MNTNRIILGLSGGSGSGKTSILRELRQRFDESQLCIVSQDEYYKPKELQLKDETGVTNFDLPESIDETAFYQDIVKLLQGEKVERLEYTFNDTRRTPRQFIYHPAPVILVEGLFVFHDKRMLDLISVKIFVHAKDNLKIIRRIKRDQVERNYPIEDVLYRYQHHVHPTYERYIAPYMEEADIVINNNESFEIGLQFLESYIEKSLGRLI